MLLRNSQGLAKGNPINILYRRMVYISAIKEQYFRWICSLIGANTKRHYRLLRHLDNIDFRYRIDMDGNREADGIELRYRFGYDANVSQVIIAAYLDNRPCSVLEMMAALALRCEEAIMSDPMYGNRVPDWFWEMVKNLGLYKLDDEHYNQTAVDRAIDIFLDREYLRNGKGGLFTLKRPEGRDMRNVEIWCQMCWYLDEKTNV